VDPVLGVGIAIGQINGRLLAAGSPVDTDLRGVKRAAAAPIPGICDRIDGAAGAHVGGRAGDARRATNEMTLVQIAVAFELPGVIHVKEGPLSHREGEISLGIEGIC
jgi:hypothetical protein